MRPGDIVVYETEFPDDDLRMDCLYVMEVCTVNSENINQVNSRCCGGQLKLEEQYYSGIQFSPYKYQPGASKLQYTETENHMLVMPQQASHLLQQPGDYELDTVGRGRFKRQRVTLNKDSSRRIRDTVLLYK